MKVFNVSYYRSHGRGYYVEIEAVVVAETANVALGMALQNEPNTIARHWEVEEIDTTKVNYHFISQHTP